MRLQVLELDHVSEVNQEVAADVCREGLKGLEMLVLTSTPVTPKALLHFNSEYTPDTPQGEGKVGRGLRQKTTNGIIQGCSPGVFIYSGNQLQIFTVTARHK